MHRSPYARSSIELGWFLGVTALLLFTAGLKLHAGLRPGAGVPGNEAVFGLPMSQWSILAGTIELVAAVLLATAPTVAGGFRVIRCLFAVLLGYRLLFHFKGGGYCGCLGRLLADSPLQSKEGLLLGGLAAFIFLANEALWLLRRHRDRRRDPNPGSAITFRVVQPPSL